MDTQTTEQTNKSTTETKDDITTRTIHSIVKQWRGGEHIMAGKRASQFAYGASKTPDESILDRIKEAAPGIERYISAPETPVTMVSDQGGDPLSKQPENDPEQINQTNLSSDSSRADQDEIDDQLKAGRERAEKAGKVAGDTTGTSELNPEHRAGGDIGEAKPASTKVSSAKASDSTSKTGDTAASTSKDAASSSTKAASADKASTAKASSADKSSASKSSAKSSGAAKSTGAAAKSTGSNTATTSAKPS